MEILPELLALTASYLQKSVAPNANKIDSDAETLLQALKGLGELGVLGLRIPQIWGGAGISEENFQLFQEIVARYSGALAFLQTQHQSAAGMIFESRNTSLMQAYLPAMSNGETLVGVGFSQLRREGKPMIVATPIDGGYQLEGNLPWVTGWGLFQEFIVAAYLADGQAVFGIVPLSETHQKSGGKITFSEPMQLAAMTSTNTVTTTLNNWFLPSEKVVSIKPVGWIHENDQKNVLRPTFLAMGCVRASLDILEAAFESKSLAFIQDAFGAFNEELSACKTAIKKAQQHPNYSLEEKLELRAKAIDLAVRCAHAAITVSSGAANNIYHAAQRVYREALVFTVTGQTTAVMEATIKQLTRFRNDKSNGLTKKTITYSKVIHLSHIIDSDIPQWPNDPPVEFETVAEIEKDGYYMRRFSLGEHSASHINAPKSFYTTGIGIEQYSAESLLVPAIVINIRHKTAMNPDYVLTIADILDWEQDQGEIAAKSLVLLYTGWQEKWHNKDAFFNGDIQGNLHFPGFSPEATEFLIKQRQISGVGIDTHGVDAGKDPTFSTNLLVLEEPRLVLENLTNLDKLPAKGTTVVIGILRLKGGSGSPAAVVALVP